MGHGISPDFSFLGLAAWSFFRQSISAETKWAAYINQFLKNNWPRGLATNASFAPFDEEVCVQRGSEADVGLVAVDECGWGFFFADADAFEFFDVFTEGFRGMLGETGVGDCELNSRV